MLNFCFLNFSGDNVCLNFSSGMLEIAASITKSMAIYYPVVEKEDNSNLATYDASYNIRVKCTISSS